MKTTSPKSERKISHTFIVAASAASFYYNNILLILLLFNCFWLSIQYIITIIDGGCNYMLLTTQILLPMPARRWHKKNNSFFFLLMCYVTWKLNLSTKSFQFELFPNRFYIPCIPLTSTPPQPPIPSQTVKWRKTKMKNIARGFYFKI